MKRLILSLLLFNLSFSAFSQLEKKDTSTLQNTIFGVQDYDSKSNHYKWRKLPFSVLIDTMSKKLPDTDPTGSVMMQKMIDNELVNTITLMNEDSLKIIANDTSSLTLSYKKHEGSLLLMENNSMTWGNPKLNSSIVIGTGKTAEKLTYPYASVIMGYATMTKATDANSNTAIGYQNLFYLESGDNNTTMGTDAGFNFNTVSNATVIGRHQFFKGDGSAQVMNGQYISALGTDCFSETTTANDLISLGDLNGVEVVSARQSQVIGQFVARYKPLLFGSFISGYQSAYAPSNPSGQIGVQYATINGYRAMYNRKNMDYSVVNGANAGFLSAYDASSSSKFVVFQGAFSGYNTKGQRNAFIGYRAGAYATPTSVDGAVAIGYRAGDGFIESNELYIDNTNTATPLIYGDFSTNSVIVNGDFEATGTVKLPIVTTEPTTPVNGQVVLHDNDGDGDPDHLVVYLNGSWIRMSQQAYSF